MSPSSALPVPPVLRGERARRAPRPSLPPVATLPDPNAPVEPAPTERDEAIVALREEARRAGFAAGRDDGWDAGFRAGRDEARAQAASLLAALAAAADDLRARDAVALGDVEDVAVGLAFDVVDALVGRELAVAEAPGRDGLARAVGLVPERGTVEVRLHPSQAIAPDELADLLPGRDVVLVADASVEETGCVVDVGPCRVDAQIGPALARVREVLGQ